MDQIIHTYAPTGSYLSQTMVWSIVILGICLISILFLQRRKRSASSKNMYSLGVMLLGFISLLAATSAFFSWLTNERIGEVIVYQDRIETNEGTILASEIKRAYLHQSTPNTPFKLNALGDTTLLLIFEMSGKVEKDFVFSEENYPIKKMMEELRPWLHKATGGN